MKKLFCYAVFFLVYVVCSAQTHYYWSGGKTNLPDGIYYLHIYDGVTENPEMIPIVVEH